AQRDNNCGRHKSINTGVSTVHGSMITLDGTEIPFTSRQAQLDFLRHGTIPSNSLHTHCTDPECKRKGECKGWENVSEFEEQMLLFEHLIRQTFVANEAQIRTV